MVRIRRTRRPFGLAAAIVVLALANCRGEASGAAMARANPASENCVASGGRLVIETAGDGGEYGVCLFEDNRQCRNGRSCAALPGRRHPDHGLRAPQAATARSAAATTW